MKTKILLAGLLFSISTFVFADDIKENSFYIQADLGGSSIGMAGRGLIGINFNKYLALEYSSLGSTLIFGKSYSVNSLSLVTKRELSENNAIAFKAGASKWKSSDFNLFSTATKDNGADIMIGIDYINNSSASFSTIFSVEHYFDINLTPVTVGVRYTF